MGQIITEIADKFIMDLMEIFTTGEKSFGEMEEAALEKSKQCAAEVVAEYFKCVDNCILYSKKSRKESGHTVERRGDVRHLQSLVGEISFERTYYKRASGGYEYLADTALGLDRRDRISEGLSQSLCEAAKGMSFQKASNHIASGAISRQSVMNAVRNREAVKEIPAEQRQITELHIDADEDHITLRGGRKAEVPLISVYEGIEKHGKRTSCKNVFHISEYGKKPDDLWEQALTEIESRYDLTHVKLYLHGDGGAWIQKGLEWLPQAIFVLDKHHKNKAIKCMTAGLLNPDRNLFDREIRSALASEDIELFDQMTASLCDELPERSEKILVNSAYLKRFVSGISICEKDPGANNGGCTEPHVSHVLSSRLSSRPMAWSKKTLASFVPMLAGGRIQKRTSDLPVLPESLQIAAVSAKNNFRRGGLGRPKPGAIGTLPIYGKVTGTLRILKSLA